MSQAAEGAKDLSGDPEESLRKLPCFQGLPLEGFGRVADLLKPRTAPIGDAIVRQNDRGPSLFLIARGAVRGTPTNHRQERSIAMLIAVDFFGEMALLRGGARTATCSAVTPSSSSTATSTLGSRLVPPCEMRSSALTSPVTPNSKPVGQSLICESLDDQRRALQIGTATEPAQTPSEVPR